MIRPLPVTGDGVRVSSVTRIQLTDDKTEVHVVTIDGGHCTIKVPDGVDAVALRDQLIAWANAFVGIP